MHFIIFFSQKIYVRLGFNLRVKFWGASGYLFFFLLFFFMFYVYMQPCGL